MSQVLNRIRAERQHLESLGFRRLQTGLFIRPNPTPGTGAVIEWLPGRRCWSVTINRTTQRLYTLDCITAAVTAAILKGELQP